MSVEVETDRVDWLAVEFVCNGTPMRLGRDRATLEAAILKIGYGLPVYAIAARLGTNTRRVLRVLERAGAVTCLYCGRYVICEDGKLPYHVHRDGVRCDMSGYSPNDVEQCALVRSSQKQLWRQG